MSDIHQILKDAELVVVLNRKDTAKSLTFNLDRSALTPECPAHVYAHFDLISLLSRVAQEWNFQRPAFYFPDGSFVTDVVQLKKSQVVFADEMTLEEAKTYQLQEPDGPRPLPIVGNIPDMLPNPALEIYKLSKKFGNFFPFVSFQ
jgi:hypothetical protein